MSLDVAYSYCTKLTEEEKLAIDKQVKKNRFELKLAIFGLFPISDIPVVPVPDIGFRPKEIVRNAVRGARDKVESAVAEQLSPLNQFAKDWQEINEQEKKYKKIRVILDDMDQRFKKIEELDLKLKNKEEMDPKLKNEEELDPKLKNKEEMDPK